jgi:hypothetical protein
MDVREQLALERCQNRRVLGGAGTVCLHGRRRSADVGLLGMDWRVSGRSVIAEDGANKFSTVFTDIFVWSSSWCPPLRGVLRAVFTQGFRNAVLPRCECSGLRGRLLPRIISSDRAGGFGGSPRVVGNTKGRGSEEFPGLASNADLDCCGSEPPRHLYSESRPLGFYVNADAALFLAALAAAALAVDSVLADVLSGGGYRTVL